MTKTTPAPKKRRSISKAKLYMAIKNEIDNYGLMSSDPIESLLESLKDDVVREATGE